MTDETLKPAGANDAELIEFLRDKIRTGSESNNNILGNYILNYLTPTIGFQQ